MTLTDWTGFIGVAILLLAYILILTNKIKQESFLYINLNLIGAAIALIASILLNYWPFIILEAAWTLVSAYGLVSMMKKKI